MDSSDEFKRTNNSPLRSSSESDDNLTVCTSTVTEKVNNSVFSVANYRRKKNEEGKKSTKENVERDVFAEAPFKLPIKNKRPKLKFLQGCLPNCGETPPSFNTKNCTRLIEIESPEETTPPVEYKTNIEVKHGSPNLQTTSQTFVSDKTHIKPEKHLNGNTPHKNSVYEIKSPASITQETRIKINCSNAKILDKDTFDSKSLIKPCKNQKEMNSSQSLDLFGAEPFEKPSVRSQSIPSADLFMSPPSKYNTQIALDIPHIPPPVSPRTVGMASKAPSIPSPMSSPRTSVASPKSNIALSKSNISSPRNHTVFPTENSPRNLMFPLEMKSPRNSIINIQNDHQANTISPAPNSSSFLLKAANESPIHFNQPGNSQFFTSDESKMSLLKEDMFGSVPFQRLTPELINLQVSDTHMISPKLEHHIPDKYSKSEDPCSKAVKPIENVSKGFKPHHLIQELSDSTSGEETINNSPKQRRKQKGLKSSPRLLRKHRKEKSQENLKYQMIDDQGGSDFKLKTKSLQRKPKFKKNESKAPTSFSNMSFECMLDDEDIVDMESAFNRDNYQLTGGTKHGSLLRRNNPFL